MNAPADRPDTTPETEPTAGSTPAPVWLFVLIAVLAFWGMGFLDRHAGGFHPRVYEPNRSYAQVEGMQPSTGSGDFGKGKKIYEAAGCVLCHQPTGLGNPSLAPPLAGSEWVLAAKPDRLVRIAWNGLTGPLQVKGVDYSNMQMANIGQALNLSAEDMAALLTFIRGNAAWGNNAPPVTAEQVKPVLEQIATRQEAWTAEELQKIPVQ
ncbi:MAG TPA: c-type cytochrome [Verrucomicrobiae bacterium]|nr:c-type cytochrome [Verrucomicrobiae bacterium]